MVLDTSTLGPLTYAWGLRNVRGRQHDVVPSVRRWFRNALASDRWGLPDLTIYLDASPEVVAARLAGATATHPADLAARHFAVARWERRFWCGRAARVAPSHVATIDAGGDREDVIATLLDRIERRGTLRPLPSARARRLVNALR